MPREHPHLRLVRDDEEKTMPETATEDMMIPEGPMALEAAEPVVPALVGLATSAGSGALVGGVAAGSWQGSLLGGALQGTLYSSVELLRTWDHIGPKTRTTLGLGAILGGGILGAVLLRRRNA